VAGSATGALSKPRPEKYVGEERYCERWVPFDYEQRKRKAASQEAAKVETVRG
jgi:hypothetical protein